MRCVVRRARSGQYLRRVRLHTYGAFGSIGRERLNVVFEGTTAEQPGDADWKAYPYEGLPEALDRMPPQIAPYQLRLDWQMWFAAMSGPQRYPWTLHLAWKLLHADPGALGLFRADPFPGERPRYVRATLYRYRFAEPASGRWWTRERIGEWLPPLAADDPRLRAFLARSRWLDGE